MILNVMGNANMKSKLLFMVIIMLAFIGCSKEQPEGEISDVSPTVTQGVSIPVADSSEEKWHIYNEQERGEIEALAEKYSEYTYRSGFVLAYYEYYDIMETKLPVIISATSEEAEDLYGGEWIDVECRLQSENSEDLPDEWAYGVLTAKQVAEVVLGDKPRYAFVTQDTSISNIAESIDSRTMKEVWGVDTSVYHLRIYVYRCDGCVSLYQDGEKLVFCEAGYPAIDVY